MPVLLANTLLIRRAFVQYALIVACLHLSFAQSAKAEEVCEEVWGLCEGSIPCVVDTVCVDIDDLVASIICSINDSCDDTSQPGIDITTVTKLQTALSDNGGILFGRSQSSVLGDFICWQPEGYADKGDIMCKPTASLRESSN